MTTITIVIVDDHPLAREGLKAVLANSGFIIIGEASSCEEAVALVKSLTPDIVLMDVRLGPGPDGLEATRQIAALKLKSKVLMLTLHDMPAYVREALAAGASGYVLKDTKIDDLHQAIIRVHQGEAVIPYGLVTAAMRLPEKTNRDEELLSSLTARETQILGLVTKGMTNKEIGRELTISPSTVKAHVEKIIAKLGVSDRTQAAVIATRQGAFSTTTSEMIG